VQDFFHPQYHTSQRPSLQVVWESLAVSLKSTIFHTGGLHCHGKITSIKMGFARLPVVVVWRLLDMTCLCNQPECSCASEDNHSNLRGCKATLQMWWRNIGKCRSVMQKKREVINYLETVWTLSLSICCWLIWYISGLWWQTEWLWHQQHAEHSSSSSCIMFSDVPDVTAALGWKRCTPKLRLLELSLRELAAWASRWAWKLG
jgi:hypothetical protein